MGSIRVRMIVRSSWSHSPAVWRPVKLTEIGHRSLRRTRTIWWQPRIII